MPFFVGGIERNFEKAGKYMVQTLWPAKGEVLRKFYSIIIRELKFEKKIAKTFTRSFFFYNV